MISVLMALMLLCFGAVMIRIILKQLRMRVSDPLLRPTLGEIVFAVILSTVVASLAAVAGFLGAAFLCARLLEGESGEAALVLAPAAALVLAIIAFSICFRKIITYGESS